MSGILRRLAGQSLSTIKPMIHSMRRLPYAEPLELERETLPDQEHIPELVANARQGETRTGLRKPVAHEMKSAITPDRAKEHPVNGPTYNEPSEIVPASTPRSGDAPQTSREHSGSVSWNTPELATEQLTPTSQRPTISERARLEITGPAHDPSDPISPEHRRASGQDVGYEADPPRQAYDTATLPVPLLKMSRANRGPDATHAAVRGAPFPATEKNRFAATDAESTEVHVHIGRIEVTATQDAVSDKSRERKAARKPMSLDEYLRTRHGGST